MIFKVSTRPNYTPEQQQQPATPRKVKVVKCEKVLPPATVEPKLAPAPQKSLTDKLLRRRSVVFDLVKSKDDALALLGGTQL